MHGLIRPFYACAVGRVFPTSRRVFGWLTEIRETDRLCACGDGHCSCRRDCRSGRPESQGVHVVPWFVVLRALVLVMGIAGAHAAEPIDINRADAQALQQGLTMVGAAKAEAIVEHRRRHGPFHRVEDLTQVKGIGKAIVERNRQRITVGNRLLPADPVPGSVPVRTVPRR
ncbi:Hypothetical protein EPM1_2660 [Stenotrophomonas maltophilia EPM1]|nr:Hypothetical protein EPM1_2660 [Stenotrophomonas maltophilia EPM1]